MTNLLIADDEQIERDALELLSSRSKLDLRCFKANNGQEAVKLISENPIDIAILDIKMPLVDGIEAARLIKEISPSTIIVFLTAWGSFDYAREAIRLGAEDYLVKPCDYETFSILISKCIHKIEQRVPQKDIQAMMNLFTREFFTALKYESIPEDTVKAFLRLKGIETESGISIIVNNQSIKAFETYWSKNNLLSSIPICYFKGLDRMLILAFARDQQSLISQLKAFSYKELILGIGKSFSSIKGFAESLHCASIAYSVAMEKKQALVIYDPKMQMDVEISNKESVELLIKAIENRNLDEALSISHKVLDGLVGLQSSNGEDNLYEFIVVLHHQLNNLIPNFSFPSPKRGIMAELDTYLTDLIQAGTLALISDSKDKYGRAFEQIKDYIQLNFSKNLCSADIASLFHISPTYFPKLFKERLGMSFVEYLTHLRMEQSVVLLKEGLTVKEVALRTGFEDSNYFARVFRQTYHRSPKAIKSL